MFPVCVAASIRRIQNAIRLPGQYVRCLTDGPSVSAEAALLNG